ncbi:MAG: histidine phosphatase family protein [Candidatus Eisenbacteria bacterium]
MADALPEVWIARHGETEWTISTRHTGRTDIPLTAHGEAEARRLRARLAGAAFARVWTSPLARARRTCELAGYGDVAQADDDLREWDYGDFEGLTHDAILARAPGWKVFDDGAPGGESVADVSARADRVIARLRADGGTALLFGHGHFSRVLGARWLGLPVSGAGLLLLSTSAVSVLGYDHGFDEPAIRLWNDTHHLAPEAG